jgi:hypothetical protein
VITASCKLLTSLQERINLLEKANEGEKYTSSAATRKLSPKMQAYCHFLFDADTEMGRKMMHSANLANSRDLVPYQPLRQTGDKKGTAHSPDVHWQAPFGYNVNTMSQKGSSWQVKGRVWMIKVEEVRDDNPMLLCVGDILPVKGRTQDEACLYLVALTKFLILHVDPNVTYSLEYSFKPAGNMGHWRELLIAYSTHEEKSMQLFEEIDKVHQDVSHTKLPGGTNRNLSNYSTTLIASATDGSSRTARLQTPKNHFLLESEGEGEPKKYVCTCAS